MMSLEEFKLFYKERGFLPNDVVRRKNPLNEKQIITRYNKFLKSEEKRKERMLRNSFDEKWEEFKLTLDLSECSLLKKFRKLQCQTELEFLIENSGNLIKVIDPAHVFSKGAYPHLKYEKENVVALNRWSHSCLDSRKHPVYGGPISEEEYVFWWKFIVGEERYQKLLKMRKNK